MEAAQKTGLLIFAVALLTSVGTDHLPDCGTMFALCSQHLGDTLLPSEAGVILAINSTYEYCTMHQSFGSCMQPSIDNSMCTPRILSVVGHYVYGGNFTCSDEASLLVEAARSSVCFNDPGEDELFHQILSCVSHTNGHDNMCQQILAERECILESSRTQCGEAYTQFVDGLYLRYWYNKYCIQNHTLPPPQFDANCVNNSAMGEGKSLVFVKNASQFTH